MDLPRSDCNNVLNTKKKIRLGNTNTNTVLQIEETLATRIPAATRFLNNTAHVQVAALKLDTKVRESTSKCLHATDGYMHAAHLSLCQTKKNQNQP